MDKRSTKHLNLWFFEGIKPNHRSLEAQAPWYDVMCLTGLDYFGSLGYAPGIAALAAGMLAPSATLVLVLLTIFGALPMYKRAAEKSPHGQGSISMLNDLFPGWGGKAIVLILLGFAATDFIITITLSAADAASHLVKNNYVHEWCLSNQSWSFFQDQMGITFLLLTVLSAVFLLGFKEAIKLAVMVVWSYIVLNVGVILAGAYQVWIKPDAFLNWQAQVLSIYKTPWHITLQSLILFPQLALGMSGFETGVAVMPLVKGDPADTEALPVGRIRNTKKLLTSAAWIMSLFLLASSVITTLLIPQSDFAPGGAADGRALAYVAHRYLGHVYGSVYDVSTILILWFSGASSLAGLLSLVPRYLPKFGMAPEWARATRPLVLFFGFVSFVVTYIFKANVDAQGGAYATGVLVLMSSAAVAVFMSIPKGQWSRLFYGFITSVFIYTTVMNIKQRPEGLHIAAFFILTIFIISLISRAIRSTELRTKKVHFDTAGEHLINRYKDKTMHIVAHHPGKHDYRISAQEARDKHYLPATETFIFLEINVVNASDFFEKELKIRTLNEDGCDILKCDSVSAPNAIASILLALRNKHVGIPHAYMYWTEGNPLFYVLRYLFLGEGETASVTREILREVEPDQKNRPKIHVV